MTVAIRVYAHWQGLTAPLRLGLLHAQRSGTREIFEFEFDRAVLAHSHVVALQLDPRIGVYEGRQHPPRGHDTFGVFADASPDRWGRMLMRRRFERDQRAGRVAKSQRLRESDFLLGVHDAYRVGALRFRRDETGPFLDDRTDTAAPPFVQLRALEAASLALERDENNTSPKADAWLRMLIAPGGSLGGARPKASVVDPSGRLWIAKFPSVRDEHDVGAWELIVQTLARRCGLQVPESLARRFGSRQHTFLVERFDRNGDERLHFASAMTLTGHQDGQDADAGVSYLELARVLMEHGAEPETDLRELWTRIVFNVLVSNCDDHLRNHGFLLVPRKGWRLSPAYDMNPVPDATGLKLNISEADNALDLELVLSVAPFFRVPAKQAQRIVAHTRSVVQQWPKLAEHLNVSSREQKALAPAFKLA